MGGVVGERRKEGKQSFFEKKDQKTSIRAVAVLSGESATAAQKLFYSGRVITRKKARPGKQFFFEKKNQKTFGRLSRFFPDSPRQRSQKSFASFLQKRRPFLPRGQIGP